VLQPYQMVKDLRTGVERSDPQKVLDGDLDEFMAASLAARVGEGDDKRRRNRLAARRASTDSEHSRSDSRCPDCRESHGLNVNDL